MSSFTSGGSSGTAATAAAGGSGKTKLGSTSLSAVLLLVVVGDLVYSGTILVGAVSQFFIVSLPSASGCVVWGSFVILGYTIVFFALPTFFILFYLQCNYPHLRIFQSMSSKASSSVSQPLLKSNRSNSSLSTTSTTSSTSSHAASRHAVDKSRVNAVLILAGVLLAVVVFSVSFQAMWAVTYMDVFDRLTECGAMVCAEKIHIHRAETTLMYVVYLLPFLICLVSCPIFAFLALRSVKRQLMLTGTYTEVERKQERDLRRLVLLYLGGFFFCYWPNILEFILAFFLPKFCETNSISDLFWLNLVQASLNPLHGFWNSMIFVWRSHVPIIIAKN